jgi:cytochrome c peroxidase
MRIGTIIAVAVAITALAATVHATTTNIEQSGQQFSEKSAALGVGDSITFANHDDVTHNINVINDDDDATDLGLQKPGESLTFKFDKAGRFKVRCSIHPSMKMTVSVK